MVVICFWKEKACFRKKVYMIFFSPVFSIYCVFCHWKVGKFTFKNVCVSLLFKDLCSARLMQCFIVEGQEKNNLIVDGYMKVWRSLVGKQPLESHLSKYCHNCFAHVNSGLKVDWHKYYIVKLFSLISTFIGKVFIYSWYVKCST